jgi:hypothetical protein
VLDDPTQPDFVLGVQRYLAIERRVITGTPQTVADRILCFKKAIGEFGTLLYTRHDWVETRLLDVILDVWSRRIVGWHIAERESADVAAGLITRTCCEGNVDPCGLVLHSRPCSGWV